MSCKFLDLRADAAGGNLASEPVPRDGSSLMTDAEVAQFVHGRDVLLGVHGFNVNRAQGIEHISGWADLLNVTIKENFCGVLWPGDSRWLPVLDYPIEGGEAIQSGRMLAKYLNRQFSNAASLSFVSHSLGARVVLETIRGLERRTRRLIMMAAAIDDDCLRDEYRDAATRIDQIAVLASRKDKTLAAAFPIGNLVEGLITPTHPFWHAALGRNGPQSPYPQQLHSPWQLWDCWGFDHKDYLHGCSQPVAKMRYPIDIGLADAFPAAYWNDDTKPAWAAAYTSTRFE
jgi:pimeloyl-ACP methyl ester carboxylesterase